MCPLMAPVNVRSSDTWPLLEDGVVAADVVAPPALFGLPLPHAKASNPAESKTMMWRVRLVGTAGKGNESVGRHLIELWKPPQPERFAEPPASTLLW
jgi:hypothetical protein